MKTYSVGFTAGGRTTGELPYARTVAQAFATDHHELVMSGRDFADHAERVVWHLDQPIADMATAPMLLLSELAARDVKMVLSGEGGDELFAGYARYAGEQFAPLLRPLPSAVRSGLLTGLARVVRGTRPKIALHALAHADEASRLAAWFPLFNGEMRRGLLTPEFAASSGHAGPDRVFAETLRGASGGDVLSRMLYVDTKLWLPDLLLARGDKMAMAASLELRVPLLDHVVAEFATRLPSPLKVRRLERKVLLRRVARDLLPAEILDRKKEGFPVPFAEWFRNEAREMVEDLLSPSALQPRGIFDPAYVSRMVRDHQSRRADHSALLWGLMGLELWLRKFVDGGGSLVGAGRSRHAV